MASYGNFVFPNRTGQAMNDLHLSFPVGTANVNVLGVDGVGPDAPNAGYNLEGDGSGEISISGYNVPVGGQVMVRMKTPGMTLPTPITAQWTHNKNPVKATFQIASLAPTNSGRDEPVSTELVDESSGEDTGKSLESEIATIEQIASEDEQLFQKDRLLIRYHFALINEVVSALRLGDITGPQALLFVRIWEIFRIVEQVLWELKRLGRKYPPEPPFPPNPPDMPKPDNPPPLPRPPM